MRALLPGKCICYSLIWFERMLISDNPASLDNLRSFEKPNSPQLSVIGRLSFFQGIIEFARIIISPENVRSKRLKILFNILEMFVLRFKLQQ